MDNPVGRETPYGWPERTGTDRHPVYQFVLRGACLRSGAPRGWQRRARSGPSPGTARFARLPGRMVVVECGGATGMADTLVVEPVTLEGRWARLEPIGHEHAADLVVAA